MLLGYHRAQHALVKPAPAETGEAEGEQRTAEELKIENVVFGCQDQEQLQP